MICKLTPVIQGQRDFSRHGGQSFNYRITDYLNLIFGNHPVNTGVT